MADAAPRRMTLDEFLAWDDGTDTRYELHDGQPVAMAPTRWAHGEVVARLSRLIGNRLAERRPECSVLIGPGVQSRRRANSYFIPDMLMTCESRKADSALIEAPVLIVEVLSDSTESTDRIVKLQEYQLFPSLTEILLIDPRRIHAQVYRRLDAERWLVLLLQTAEARLHLESVDFDLALDEVYRGIPLD